MEAPNLVELPPDYTESIDPVQVSKGHSTLGHVSHKIMSPNMSLNPARDLSYFRQTEAIFNVIRENDKIQRLSMTSNQGDGLRCHGMNSVKDYLSSTKLESTTMMESGIITPPYIREGLNQ